MIEYVAILAFILILSPIFFYKKRSKIVNIIFTILCFGVLFAVSAARFSIGNDYVMYSRGFFKMGMDGFEKLEYTYWEIGFVLLTKIVVYFTRDIHVYWAVLAIICLAGPCYVICRYSKKPWLSVLLYVNLYFFYLTMNFMRQALALSIALFAFTFLTKKKIFPYIIPYIAIIVLAATFHRSVLLMLPVFFIAKIKLSYKIPVAYGLIIVPSLIFSNSIAEAILKFDILPGRSYSVYLNGIIFWTEGIDLIHLLIPSIVIATCVCFIMKFAKYDKILSVYANLMFFGYIFIVLMMKHAILERISYYAYIYVILYIPEFLVLIEDILKNYFKRKLIKPTEKLVNQDESVSVTEGIDTNSIQGNSVDGISSAIKYTAKKYKVRIKVIMFCITASVVIGTLSYNIFGLLSGSNGVHGVYPYQTWLYEDVSDIFSK